MKARVPILAFVVCALVFAGGLFQLPRLRFEGGDVYPPYSSLRSDPLGTMALYEALARLPGLMVQRDFTANTSLPGGRNTTYLHLGARLSDWTWVDENEFRVIEDFVTAGGRLVITFFPENTSRASFPGHQDEAADKSGRKEADQKAPPSKPNKRRTAPPLPDRIRKKSSVADRWGISIGFRELAPGTNKVESTTVERQVALALPENLEWHSGVLFTNLSSKWQTIYARGTNPVLVERKLGAGSVVMAGDSFLLSNEALVNQRQPELLSWLVGPSQDIVFDEAHFGILQTQGVATLLRKYHLYAVVGALLLLAILFIWKNAFSFVPPLPTIQAQPFVAGRETSAGFINLLRRNISSRDLLQVCFAQWKKSVVKSGGTVSTRHARVDALMKTASEGRPSESQSLLLYQEICRTLKKL
jgi:hypothetical protein